MENRAEGFMADSGSDSGHLTDNQQLDAAPQQPQSTSDFDSLSRCAACYNPKAMYWRGEDGESSSSAGDSGPDLDSDSDSVSDSESSSSSCWSAVGETPEEPEMETHSSACEVDAEPESAGGDADGREGTGETLDGQGGKRATKRRSQRPPLVKSLTLPASFTPHLSHVSLLPRPRNIVSTLHLQVTPKIHKDEGVINICQQLPERHDGGQGGGGGGGGGGGRQPFQVGRGMLPWQQSSRPTLEQRQQMSHQSQLSRSVSAQGESSSPASHTQPMSHLLTPYAQPHLWRTNAQQTQHVHTLPPQPCWYCHYLRNKAPAYNFW